MNDVFIPRNDVGNVEKYGLNFFYRHNLIILYTKLNFFLLSLQNNDNEINAIDESLPLQVELSIEMDAEVNNLLLR